MYTDILKNSIMNIINKILQNNHEIEEKVQKEITHILKTATCDTTKTNIHQTLNEFNRLQPTIKFTIEKEEHESIHFLDHTIHQKDKHL
jgi:hypothetical protein